MKRDEILSRLNEIIGDKIGLEGPLNEDDNIFYDLGFDSLDIVEAIMECEKEFSIRIEDNDIENIETIKEVLDFLEGVLK